MSETSSSYLYKKCVRLNIPIQQITSKDELHTPLQNGAYIINMSNHDKAGTHWVALFIKDNVGVYFDSFGIIYANEVLSACRESGITKIIWNKDEIQNINSGYCGVYCLFFLHFMLSHKIESETFDKFSKLFSDDQEDNKRILLKRMKEIYKNP